MQANPETVTDPDGHCWPLCTMLIGAVVGAAISAGSSIVSQAASGHGVNWGEVGKQAAVGAVSGAISGLAGPEAGLLARGAIDTAASVGGQVLSNALEHKPLGDGVGQAAVTGALMSVGLGAAGGLLAKGASRFFGAVAKDAEGEVGGGLERGASCALSFSPDTAVATPSGEKPIAQVKTGDAVTAYDPHTGTASTQRVTATSIHHDENLVDITLYVSGPAANSTATASAVHATMQVDKASSHAASATKATATSSSSMHDEVVHTTTNHPWLTADHGWLPASFLRIGEPVQRADGTTATVVAVHAVPGTAAMWDLTVSNVHTFAVGAGQYVVHNCGGGKAADEVASDLHSKLDGVVKSQKARDRTIVAVGYFKNADGDVKMVASTNYYNYGPKLEPHVNAMGGEWVRGNDHAEINILNWGARNPGWELQSMGASIDFCAERCFPALSKLGGTFSSNIGRVRTHWMR